uniref:NADH-ubiquinone oxidoreductase chain 6 n=1 Tax=Atrocalopteryx melli TaxID=2060406 RepID=A0A343RT78_9ODON|nr:NADH dehydrogenase subunit 6 [Atrocalopteryx melli]AUG33617.1 NADH dehydrogenase subunit 6 [Atrocalopteryx melli]
MSQLIVISFTTLNATLFSMMKHPMSTGIVLMTQTILMCFMTNNMARDAWFSYILFLVFLGGMLVLFIYLTSVASNELFNKPSYKFIWMIPMMMLVMMLIDPILMTNNSEDIQALEMKEIINTTTMFNYPYSVMTVAVIMYLFLTLIVVVKITESHTGPLRSNN